MRRACFGLLCLAAAGSARAQPSPQDLPQVLLVGVEPTPGSGNGGVPSLVPRRVAERLAADLAAEPGLTLLAIYDDAADAATAPPPPPPTDRTQEARDAIAAAGAALAGKDGKLAEERALAAIAALDASLAALADETPYAEAYTALGAARALRGDEAGARAAFLQVLALSPATLPDPGKWGRKPGKQWKAARKAADALARGGVRVEVSPQAVAATVFLDGANHGEAPVEILDLQPGDHLLRVVAEGHQPYAAKVPVSAGTPGTLPVTLTPLVVSSRAPDAVRGALRAELRKRASAGLVDAAAKPVAARLAERIGATHLVLGMLAARDGGYTLRLFVFRARGGLLVELDAAPLSAELLDVEAVTLRASRAVVATLADFPVARDITASLGKVDAKHDGKRKGLVEDARRRGQLGGPAPEGERPVWKKPWFWAATGAFVLGTVFLTVALASPGDPSGYDGTVTLP